MSNPNRPLFRTLTQILEDLEQNDPQVRAAVQNLDNEIERMLFWDRLNSRRISEGKSPIGPFVKRHR